MKSIGPSLPAEVAAYKRTPTFATETVPAGLLREHATKAGVWGRIEVVEGRLRYVVPESGIDVLLDPSTQGIIAPKQVHRVEPVGEVRFFVTFLK